MQYKFQNRFQEKKYFKKQQHLARKYKEFQNHQYSCYKLHFKH